MGNRLVHESAGTLENHVLRWIQQDPQRLQSVPGLAHTHVFAKPKIVPVTEKTTNHLDESLSQ